MVSAGTATLVALAASLLVLALKLAAYFITGSTALLSDAAESVVNVAAAVAVVYSVRTARRPPDYRHPYGHAKAEYFSAVLEGALILVAAGVILATSVRNLFAPPPLENVTGGVVVAAAALVINVLTAFYLLRVASRRESAALRSNARHLLTDVWTSVGVLVAVPLVAVSGWTVVDPAIATLIGMNIVRQGWSVLTDSLSSLLDERLSHDEEQSFMEVLHESPDVLGFHRLLTRRSGYRRFAEVDVFVDPELDVVAAHDIASALKQELESRMPNLQVTIHVEPFLAGERDRTTTPREEYPR